MASQGVSNVNLDWGTTKCSKPASKTVAGVADTLLVANGAIADGDFDSLLWTFERKLDSLAMTGSMMGNVLRLSGHGQNSKALGGE
jgi:hypothetical protein